MKKFCFKRHLDYTISYGIIAAFCLVISLLMQDIFLRIVCTTVSLIPVVWFIHYLRTYLIYNKKSENLTPEVGVITDRHIMHSKYGTAASVILKANGKEYRSPHYFSNGEAYNMIGKRVTYVTVKKALLIYEIHE